MPYIIKNQQHIINTTTRQTQDRQKATPVLSTNTSILHLQYIMSDEDDIINCFKLFDTENSGKCNTDALLTALINMGDVSKSDAEALVEEVSGGKSKFDYEKFVKKMNKKAKGG